MSPDSFEEIRLDTNDGVLVCTLDLAVVDGDEIDTGRALERRKMPRCSYPTGTDDARPNRHVFPARGDVVTERGVPRQHQRVRGLMRLPKGPLGDITCST